MDMRFGDALLSTTSDDVFKLMFKTLSNLQTNQRSASHFPTVWEKEIQLLISMARNLAWYCCKARNFCFACCCD